MPLTLTQRPKQQLVELDILTETEWRHFTYQAGQVNKIYQRIGKRQTIRG